MPPRLPSQTGLCDDKGHSPTSSTSEDMDDQKLLPFRKATKRSQPTLQFGGDEQPYEDPLATSDSQQQQHQQQKSSTALATTSTSNNNSLLQQNSMMYGGGMNSPFMGSPMMGMAGYGMGSLGMMGGAYGGGGYMLPSPLAGAPLSGLNQFLFGVQSVIFSLSQAVQIIGMNTQALHQLVDMVSTMFDHAVQTWHEMRTLDQMKWRNESEEEQKKRRRLRALRWALLVGATYSAYRILRMVLTRMKSRHSRRHRRGIDWMSGTVAGAAGSMLGYQGTTTTGMYNRPIGYGDTYGYQPHVGHYNTYGGGGSYPSHGGGFY